MIDPLKKKAAIIKIPLGILLILLLVGIAFLVSSPAGAAAGVKALAIIFIIAVGLFIGKACHWISRR